jgi:excisionase family DNA binding protein
MEEFLTVAEVAPLVKMSEQALYAAIRENKFPAVHIGSRIRVPLSMLKRWIDSGGTIHSLGNEDSTTRKGEKRNVR